MAFSCQWYNKRATSTGSLTLFLVSYEETQTSLQIKKRLNNPLLIRARGTLISIRKTKMRKRINKKSENNRLRKRKRPSKRSKDWKSRKHSSQKQLLMLNKVKTHRSRQDKYWQKLKSMPKKRKIKMITSLLQREMAVEQTDIFGRRL